MKLFTSACLLTVVATSAPSRSTAQSASQNSSVRARPGLATEIWAANRGNDSVSVIDTVTGQTVAEIEVGVWPRSIGFTCDGTRAFVANQRGNVDVETDFVSPFTGSELRGTVSVIDTQTRAVTMTLTDVGVEPYGLTVAPNGLWFAVTGHRSGTVRLYSTSFPFTQLQSFQYDRSLNQIDGGKTIADVDSNSDFLPDLDEPRALAITPDSSRMFVTHSLPGFVSVLDVTLDGSGLPTGLSLATKIDLNTYTLHPIFDPTPVQTLQSQGTPRFLDDVALSPDGTVALIPHVLHNVNHDVNHDFGPSFPGDFANRVYPALSVVDAQNLSYAAPSDASKRLHHELSSSTTPAEHVPYLPQGLSIGGGVLTLGGTGSPVLGGTADYVISGSAVGDMHLLYYSPIRVSIPTPRFGTIVIGQPRFRVPMTGNTASLAIPNDPSLDGMSAFFQGIVIDGSTGLVKGSTNGVETVVSFDGLASDELGHRPGQPGRVLFNTSGDHALLLNRGSEDIFLYSVENGAFTLRTVYPPRHGHVERAALDDTTPLGDLPLGMTLVADPSTSNRDALLYVINETSRTLSTLRVDFDAGTILQEAPQIPTLLGPDEMTVSERKGQELFEDASRSQTTGLFNNSCASCHFEGGADGNVWQRDDGPRSTMPVYGGADLTGLLLWKGVRLNMGETGPMFGGENGGHGLLTDEEQQALVDYHQIIPVPLNPNLDPVTGGLTADAALGSDLFHGTDDTGLNPSLRHAGCASCHPSQDPITFAVRSFTTDVVDPTLALGENLETFDPSCFSLRSNLLTANIRGVNSGVNVDVDMDGFPDLDRNADGIIDIESYVPMNTDKTSMFTRDDPNSYLCPLTPGTTTPLRTFQREMTDFSVPTKLGVFSTGPYFHDHSISSLRMVLDPAGQTTDPIYGDPSFPTLNKFLNEFHDIRGDDSVVQNASKVQVTLQTLIQGSTIDADVTALLAYIESL